MLRVRVPPGLKSIDRVEMNKFKRFLKEVNVELRKVTWPSKDELIGSTIVVIIVSFMMAIFIGIVDKTLTLIVTTIFGGGSGG